MQAGYSELKSADRIVARFLLQYYSIWQRCFPGLNKRAHWHAIFMARTNGDPGVSSRAIHRTLYGSYGTDIRTCIERIKDCESDGFINVLDAAGQPCTASPACLIAATPKLRDSFDRHCRDTIEKLCAIFGGRERLPAIRCDDAISPIFSFFNSYDQNGGKLARRSSGRR